MAADSIFNVMGLIVVVAIVAVIVGSSNSQSVIRSMGQAFSGSIQAALGHSVTS